LTGACFSMKKARRNLIAARFCYCCVRHLPVIGCRIIYPA
jgi:hypothetical protein